MFIFFILFFYHCSEAHANAQFTYQFEPKLSIELETAIQHALESNPSIDQEAQIHIMHDILKAYGYLSGVCTVDSAKATHTVRCNIGKPTVVSTLDITTSGQGKKALDLSVQRHDFELQIGDVFSTRAYENIKQSLIKLARSLGYLEANASQSQVLLNPAQHQAILRLHIDTGEAFSFGAVQFSSNAINHAFLKTFAPFQPGSPYQSEAITAFQSTLLETGLFTSVKVQPSIDFSTHTVPIYVQSTPVQLWSSHLMVGYDTDENFIGLAEITRNRLSSYGAKWNNAIRLSKQSYQFDSELLLPKTHPKFDFYQINIEALDQELEPSGRSLSAGLHLSHHRIHKNTETHTRTKRILRINTTVEKSITSESEVSNHWRMFMYPDAQATLARKLSTRTNIDIEGQCSGAVKPLSPESFLRAHVKLRTLTNISSTVRMLSRGQAGMILTPSQSSPLPLSWYFRAGGMDSVRGFSYHSLGDPTIFRNTKLLTGTLEAQKEIIPSLFINAFTDVGTSGTSLDRYAAAIGLGVIWESPLGNIELSIGKPIANPFTHDHAPHLGFALRHNFF